MHGLILVSPDVRMWHKRSLFRHTFVTYGHMYMAKRRTVTVFIHAEQNIHI